VGGRRRDPGMRNRLPVKESKRSEGLRAGLGAAFASSTSGREENAAKDSDVEADFLPIRNETTDQSLGPGLAVVTGRETIVSAASKRDGPDISQVKIFLGGLSLDATRDIVEKHFEKFGEIESVSVPTNREFPNKSRGFGFVAFKSEETARRVVDREHIICGRIVDVKFAEKHPNEADNQRRRGWGSLPHRSPYRPPSQSSPSSGSFRTGQRPQRSPKSSNRSTSSVTTQLNTTESTGFDGSASHDADSHSRIFVGGLATSVGRRELGDYFQMFGTVMHAVVMMDHDTFRSRGFGFVTFEDEEAVKRSLECESEHMICGKVVEVKRAIPREQISRRARKETQVSSHRHQQYLYHQRSQLYPGHHENTYPSPPFVYPQPMILPPDSTPVAAVGYFPPGAYPYLPGPHYVFAMPQPLWHEQPVDISRNIATDSISNATVQRPSGAHFVSDPRLHQQQSSQLQAGFYPVQQSQPQVEQAAGQQELEEGDEKKGKM